MPDAVAEHEHDVGLVAGELLCEGGDAPAQRRGVGRPPRRARPLHLDGGRDVKRLGNLVDRARRFEQMRSGRVDEQIEIGAAGDGVHHRAQQAELGPRAGDDRDGAPVAHAR